MDGRPWWIDTEWRPTHSTRGAKPRRHHKILGYEAKKLALAREILGIAEETDRFIGPYQLATDVQDTGFLGHLDAIARHAEDAYFARYGRRPGGESNQAMILFQRRDDYRRYSDSIDRGRGGSTGVAKLSEVSGHAGSGVLTFYAEGRVPETLGQTFLHEINHRAIGPILPPWLEEGMASDIGTLWLEDPDEVAHPPWTRPADPSFRGRDLYSYRVQFSNTDLVPVDELLVFARQLFHQRELQAFTYAHSVLLVRYLLDAEMGRHADGFREFLKKLAFGLRYDPRLLYRELGVDSAELEEGFRTWLNDVESASAEVASEDL
ncbi:MAG: hypothetical protein VYE73_05155 [Acidobacteriota bacterium]|nr:hypothetical protein [Acidobacteriota bacterium]